MADESDESPRRLIIGLGNPGERYAATRHNVGFRVIEALARRRQARERQECGALVAGAATLLLARPQTYMNRSGYAARCLLERHGFEPSEVLVVYDEIHLPLGTLRLRPRGSPAGHRGVESVLENLGTDRVPRLRLGIAGDAGPDLGEALVAFVLEPFAADERERVETMISRAADACETWAEEGIDAAMQRWNGPPPAPPDTQRIDDNTLKREEENL